MHTSRSSSEGRRNLPPPHTNNNLQQRQLPFTLQLHSQHPQPSHTPSHTPHLLQPQHLWKHSLSPQLLVVGVNTRCYLGGGESSATEHTTIATQPVTHSRVPTFHTRISSHIMITGILHQKSAEGAVVTCYCNHTHTLWQHSNPLCSINIVAG